MNICANCEHRVIPKGTDGSHWFHNLCGAPEQEYEAATNPVTGEPCYTVEMDEGVGYTNERHPLCANVNPQGQCTSYVEVAPMCIRRLQLRVK